MIGSDIACANVAKAFKQPLLIFFTGANDARQCGGFQGSAGDKSDSKASTTPFDSSGNGAETRCSTDAAASDRASNNFNNLLAAKYSPVQTSFFFNR